LALGSSGYRTTVLESRSFLGGRATSYPLNNAEDGAITIDNCQHILLRCCINLIDFYQRLGVENRIHFYREFFWIEPSRHAERRSDDRLSAASISPASSLLVVQIKRLVPDTQCRKRAESARTGVASRKTGVRAKAALALGSKLNQIVG